jgi:hypothetical protein
MHSLACPVCYVLLPVLTVMFPFELLVRNTQSALFKSGPHSMSAIAIGRTSQRSPGSRVE